MKLFRLTIRKPTWATNYYDVRNVTTRKEDTIFFLSRTRAVMLNLGLSNCNFKFRDRKFRNSERMTFQQPSHDCNIQVMLAGQAMQFCPITWLEMGMPIPSKRIRVLHVLAEKQI